MDASQPPSEAAPAEEKPVFEDVEKKFDIDKEFSGISGLGKVSGFHRGLGREFWQLIIELITTSCTIFIISLSCQLSTHFPRSVDIRTSPAVYSP